MKLPWSRLVGLAAAVLAVMPAGLAAADPSLLVSPTRVVFEGAKRTAVLTLLNNGTDPGTYRLFLVHYRMTPTGGFEEVKEPSAEDKLVDSLIRFTPKQVVLPPKQSQVVRIQLRKPEHLAAGEYRTHLLFRVLPQAPAAGDAKAPGIQIKLIPAVGVSIPLIVREGETSATAGLAGLSLLAPEQAGGNARLSLRLERSGNRSVYGNLVARFQPKGGGEREVGRANGVAVYTPNATRQAILPLNERPDTLAHGTLRVVFQEPEAEGKVLAQAELPLP